MQEEQKEPIVTLSDLFNLFKRNKKKVLRTTLCCSLLLCFWPGMKPVQYLAEGTFRDKGSTAAGMSERFNAALVSKMGAKSLENEATTTMKSRTLLKELIKKLHLHGSISEKKRAQFSWFYLPQLAQHMYTEYRLFFYRPTLFYKDKHNDLVLKDISFDSEEPYGALEVTFSTEEDFTLYDRGTNQTFEGKIDVPLAANNYSFTIAHNHAREVAGRTYSIQLRPLDLQVAILGSCLNVKADKEDKTLVRIECTHPDRHMTAQIVNTLMDVYQNFKKDELKRIAEEQLDYLSTRHDQINTTLGAMMADHAKSISQDLLKIGFPNAQTAIDFLSTNQSQQQQRLLTIDLETKRLEQAQKEGYSFFDHYTPHGDPGVINSILAEVRELKKQSDNIQLSLHETSVEKEQESLIVKYVEELNALAKATEEAETLLATVKSGTVPATIPDILSTSKYLVKSWWSQLAQANPLEQEKIKSQFVAYMEQLIRLFEVHSNTLTERLTRHQNPMLDFEGIDLTSARELYINYSKQLNELEANGLQYDYILGEMQNPEFEVTSLGTVLTDPVSQEMITQTSRLALQLNETHNRSAKEQQRIREEIAVKKGFLAMHIKNAGQLLTLRQGLVRDKIRTLQETTLALLQQQISLLDKHLSDYLAQRVQDLQRERTVLVKHQLELNAQMSSLPEKLSEEKIIDQRLRINTGVAEEVSRLIESKNLASNLEVSRSVPVEVATVPIKPKSPKLIFFAILGAFVGFFFHMSFLVGRTLMRGMPVSVDNLRASGYDVSGTLSPNFDHASNQPLRDNDFETLRHVLAFLPNDPEPHTLLVCENGGSNFSHSLATLLGKREQKTLIMDLSFDQHSDEGLLQFLEGKSSQPTISKGESHDTILGGGISRFSSELLDTKKFHSLLKELSHDYEWIIGVTRNPSLDAETKKLLSLFEYSVIALSEQTLQDVQSTQITDHTTFIVGS